MDSTNLYFSGTSDSFRLSQSEIKEESSHEQEELRIDGKSHLSDVYGIIDCSNWNSLCKKLLIRIKLNARDHEELQESHFRSDINPFIQDTQANIQQSSLRSGALSLTQAKVLHRYYFNNEKIQLISKMMNLPEQQILQILYEFRQAISLKENELSYLPSLGKKIKTCHIEWLKEYTNKIIGVTSQYNIFDYLFKRNFQTSKAYQRAQYTE